MARPYSKKTVDNAETILLVCAQTCFDTAVRGFGLYDYAAELGFRDYETSTRLAYSAWCGVRDAIAGSFADVSLEAAALIRSGWMIGDPIDLLAPDDDSIIVPNVCLDKPISMSAMVDKYKTEECSTFAAADVVLSTVSEQALATSSKDYTDEVGKTIDDGPHDPAIEVEAMPADELAAKRAAMDEAIAKAEPATAEEVIDAAIEQHYNGDYGADS